MWLAQALQVASVALLRAFLGKRWLRRPGTLLVLASVVYDGVSQVLLSFPSVGQWDIFRNGIRQPFIDGADLIISTGMLAFTIAYLVACDRRDNALQRGADAVFTARVLDWRWLAFACLPLAVLTYEGRGFAGAGLATGAGAGTATSVAAQFFVLLVALTAVAFLLRHGSRYFVPVLALQSVLLAATGERAPVIWAALSLCIVLAQAGRGPRRSHMHAAVALTLLAVLAITGLRAVNGRAVFRTDSGLNARVTALASGAGARPQHGSPGLLAQAAVRLDDTAFAGAIVQAEHSGQPRLSAWGVPDSLLLVIPRAAWPSKLESSWLNPYQAETATFRLQHVNFLPGLAGLYVGFLPSAWLIAFLTGLGWLCGRAERWLLRRDTPARLVLLTGAVQAALVFEAGLPFMLIVLRSAAVIAAAVWIAQVVTEGHSRRPIGLVPMRKITLTRPRGSSCEGAGALASIYRLVI